jgi:chromosome segregation ATPase
MLTRRAADLASADAALKDLHGANEQLRAQLQSTSQQLSQASEEVSVCQSSLSVARQEVDSLRCRVATLEADLGASRREAHAAVANAADLSAKLGDVTRRLAAADSAVVDARGRVAELEAAVSTAAADLRKLHRDGASAQQRLLQLEDSERQLQSQLDVSQHLAKCCQEELDDVRRQLTHATSEVSALKAKVDKEADAARRAKAEVATLQERLASLSDEVSALRYVRPRHEWSVMPHSAFQECTKAIVDASFHRHYRDHYDEMHSLAMESKAESESQQRTIEQLSAEVRASCSRKRGSAGHQASVHLCVVFSL